MPFEPPNPVKVALIALGSGLVMGLATAAVSVVSQVEEDRIRQMFEKEGK